MTSFFSNVTWVKFVYDSGSTGISMLELPGCSSDLGRVIPSDSVDQFCKSEMPIPWKAS